MPRQPEIYESRVAVFIYCESLVCGRSAAMRSGVFCTCVACWAVSAADGMPPAWPAGCIFGGGKDFRLYFDVKINCITFAGVSVSRSRPGRSGNQKGNGWDARTVPAAVCSSAARRDCGAALFNHWSCGTGKVPPPERVRRPADAEPCAHACGERAGAKQGLFRMPCHYARSAARRVRMRPQAYYTCMRRCRTQGPERCCGIC